MFLPLVTWMMQNNPMIASNFTATKRFLKILKKNFVRDLIFNEKDEFKLKEDATKRLIKGQR